MQMEINLDENIVEELVANLNDDYFIENSRSLTELVESFAELNQNKEEMLVSCVVCNPPDNPITKFGNPAAPRPGVFFYTEDVAQVSKTKTRP